MEKGKNFVSIGTKITIMALVMVIVSIFSICIFSYYSYRSDSIKLQGDATMAAANALSAAIDAERFKEVAETDEKNAYYWQMRELLNAARAKTDVLYIYTMVKANDGVNYKYIHASADSDYDSQGDLDTIESYGAPALTAYDTGISSVSGIYDNGEYGYMVSAFVPITDLNGDVVGLICADKSADDVIHHLNNYRNRVILAAVLLTILFATASVIYTNRSFGNPIRRLAELSERIVEGQLDVVIDIKHNDEIGLLADSFLHIRDTLNKLVLSLHKMSEVHLSGQLDYFVDSTQFTGAYQIVVNETNEMVREYVNSIWAMLSTLKGFGKGDFNIALREFPGQKKHANEAIEVLRAIFSGLSKEIGALAVYSADGDLSKKIDTSKYEGDWRFLAEGLNKLLEAIRNPISESVYVLRQMADGDFRENVRGDYKGDFSLIKNSLNKTMDEISLYISEINNVLNEMSEQNLQVSIDKEYIGDFGGIKASINMIIEKFNYVLGSINSSATQVALGAKQISDLSVNLAQGSTEQASATEELNSSIEQIAVQTDKNTYTANKANELVAVMRKSAEMGNNEMKTMIIAMKGISDSSTSISKIIKTIDDIAFQTNLLALNAAVEAAQAGIHGKGFVVVAEEVRNLASRSKTAAQETAVLIEDSIQKALEGVCISDGMAVSLEIIVEQISEVSKLINVIAEASKEQSSNMYQINQGIMQISQVTQANSALSEESSTAAAELSSQAEQFRNEIAKFKFRNA